MNGRSPKSCRPLVRARAVPLRAGEPLQILLEQHLVGELAARAVDRRRLAALQIDRPFAPRPLAFARVHCPEQRVILDPPRLLADVAAERARAIGVATPLGLDEAVEGGTQRRDLQPPDVAV